MNVAAPGDDGGHDKYAKQRRYSAKKAVLTSDISPIPKRQNPERRESCRHDLRLFLETYFPEAFPLAWSPGHLEVIGSIERAIVEGGSSAIAMPRGSGKTTLVIRAALWAILYGKSPFVMVVAADAGKADKILDTIKQLLWFNDRLFEDFPEVCHPVRCLQGLSINAAKQHVAGELTLMDWKKSVAQMPCVAGSECSGARIEVAGVTAAARGAQRTLPDGTVIRPTLVLIDDFQTRESAASPLQSKTRLDIIAGDLAGMKGPDQPLAMLAAITVIYPDDAAEQLLDRERNPEWRGVKQKMVVRWPDRDDLWDKYAELRLGAIRNGEPPDEAEAFLTENWDEMHRGGEVAWPERKGDDRSAIQHAYNLKLRIGDEAFEAEYQNTPVSAEESAIKLPNGEEIAAKVSGRAKGELPSTTERIVAAIDVQTNHLWYGIIGWQDGFTGTILDYGTLPDQRRRFFTKRTLPKDFASVEKYRGKTEEAAIYAALCDLLEDLRGRSWVDDAGVTHQISRVLVDEGYQTDTVHLAIRQGGFANFAAPAKGVGIKATGTPMTEWVRARGEPHARHEHWRVKLSRGQKSRLLRTVHWDTNYWRAFVRKRFMVDQGDVGCLSFWGKSNVAHRLAGAHFDAMTYDVVQAGSREVIEFTQKPLAPDKDLDDVFSMCCVAGSEQGVILRERGQTSPRQQVLDRESGDTARLSLDEYFEKRRRKKRAA